jgi:hypothetical protein
VFFAKAVCSCFGCFGFFAWFAFSAADACDAMLVFDDLVARSPEVFAKDECNYMIEGVASSKVCAGVNELDLDLMGHS